MDVKRLILISLLLSSLIICSFIGYSIYKRRKLINLPELVNREDEEENQPNFENEKKAESKKEEPIEINNELDLIEINGRLDFLFLFVVSFFAAYFICVLMREISCHIFDKVIADGRYPPYIKDICLDVGRKKLSEYRYQEKKAFGRSNDISDVQLRDELREVVKEIIFYDSAIKYECFHSLGIKKAYSNICRAFNRWRATLIIMADFFVLPFIVLFICCLYFVIKSFCQVGFRKTINNFTWFDLLSFLKIFCHNSWFKKIFFGLLFGLLSGGSIFVHWLTLKAAFNEKFWKYNSSVNTEANFIMSVSETCKNSYLSVGYECVGRQDDYTMKTQKITDKRIDDYIDAYHKNQNKQQPNRLL